MLFEAIFHRKSCIFYHRRDESLVSLVLFAGGQMLSHGGIKCFVKTRRRTLFHRFKLTLLIIQGEEDLFCPPLLLVVLLERRRPFHVMWRSLGGLGGFHNLLFWDETVAATKMDTLLSYRSVLFGAGLCAEAISCSQAPYASEVDLFTCA